MSTAGSAAQKPMLAALPSLLEGSLPCPDSPSQSCPSEHPADEAKSSWQQRYAAQLRGCNCWQRSLGSEVKEKWACN